MWNQIREDLVDEEGRKIQISRINDKKKLGTISHRKWHHQERALKNWITYARIRNKPQFFSKYCTYKTECPGESYYYVRYFLQNLTYMQFLRWLISWLYRNCFVNTVFTLVIYEWKTRTLFDISILRKKKKNMYIVRYVIERCPPIFLGDIPRARRYLLSMHALASTSKHVSSNAIYNSPLNNAKMKTNRERDTGRKINKISYATYNTVPSVLA